MGWTVRIQATLFLLIFTRQGKRTLWDIHPTSCWVTLSFCVLRTLFMEAWFLLLIMTRCWNSYIPSTEIQVFLLLKLIHFCWTWCSVIFYSQTWVSLQWCWSSRVEAGSCFSMASWRRAERRHRKHWSWIKIKWMRIDQIKIWGISQRYWAHWKLSVRRSSRNKCSNTCFNQGQGTFILYFPELCFLTAQVWWVYSYNCSTVVLVPVRNLPFLNHVLS